MITRRFGRTEIAMPVLSCGGMRYMYKWQDVEEKEIPRENQRNLEATIRRALELGIRHIETARGYGTSERQLGRLMPRLKRDEFILQTKVTPKKDVSEFVAEFHDSLKRLRVDFVDLFALHGLNNEELIGWALKPNGCLAAARKLQSEGRARHIGFSTHAPLDLILEVIKHERDGGFDYVNLHWYFIFQRNLPAIEEAARRDMGVFIISPSDKGGKLYDPGDEMRRLCAPLDPIVFNDLFCLRNPNVHTISIGAARPGDFDLHLEAVRLLDQAEELVPPIVERLEGRWRERLGEEFGRRWEEGLPNWKDTPGEVNIPVIVWLRNLARAYDLVGYGKLRYNLLGDGGHWFPGQKITAASSEELRAACARSPFPEEIVSALMEAHQLFHEEKK
ncbi:MAG: aldo/keto reductase [Candidatus Hydrogenedentota bacterium]|nr:MAG: aldo/keto reductase [Candidatus Hydrogenedentota bacterium]